MAKLFNRVYVGIATTGTGNITFGAALAGFQTPASAGAVDADTAPYVITDGDDWETGTITFSSSATIGARTVIESTNGDAALNLSDAAKFWIGATAGYPLLKPDRHDTLLSGYDSNVEPLGAVTSGTVTPEVDGDTKPNFKTLTNNGAFTLAPPSTSSATTIRIRVINGASAGAITTSGFDAVFDVDAYATISGGEYWFYIDHDGVRSTLTIREIV